MGIYIKGLELPECCDKCPFKSYVGVDHLECKITGYRFYVWEVGWGDKPYTRHESCPLIEIPDKHGRLIDADALYEEMSKGYLDIKEHDGISAAMTYACGMHDVKHAPTVIEADYPPSTPLEQVWTELFGEDGE